MPSTLAGIDFERRRPALYRLRYTGRPLAENFDMPFFEVSCKQDINIEDAFLTLARRIREQRNRREFGKPLADRNCRFYFELRQPVSTSAGEPVRQRRQEGRLRGGPDQGEAAAGERGLALRLLVATRNTPRSRDANMVVYEATFHVSGKVNRHNCRIWGSENPSVVIEHQRDSPKWNVWCGIMRDRIIGPYFFAEKTVTANTYLDMLQLYAVPQLPDGAIFQQDGAPPHFANMVRTFLDEQFPARWIGRGSPYITWPARSPDLTPPDFFLWGFVKDQVYRTPVRDLADLQERIYAAVNNVTPQMLHNTWVEVEYRLDISRATNGSHVEIYGT
ncbi:hypothetical protein ANN_25937 [Periplaneta americana]|uniref:Transposable element Tc3 transposase n=1 Tax=Periplaneta americana TaxID=6978 RepID=A0ABQ8S4Z0_PERAM|nr:hypothetical protein ANN_25937 [Periplaneta americana]